MANLSEFITSLFREGQECLEQTMLRIIAPPDFFLPNLDDGMAYALGLDSAEANAGKRIRPLLCLLVCRILGGDYKPAIPFATAIELMHNFCLVHDDIEDGDEYRRGRPAVWKKYDLCHGINIGDYLFTKVFEALLLDTDKRPAEMTVRMFELMRSTLDHTHRGQALDMNARTGRISIEAYMHLVTEKTGYYLAAPLVAGAMAANADPGTLEALQRFGLKIGPMFQVRDDLIDLTHGKGRESIGSDIREGKRSFLVAHALDRASEADQARLMEILDQSRQDTSQAHVEEALAIFTRCGALEAADNLCRELTEQAFAELDALPPDLAGALREITEYLAARTA